MHTYTYIIFTYIKHLYIGQYLLWLWYLQKVNPLTSERDQPTMIGRNATKVQGPNSSHSEHQTFLHTTYLPIKHIFIKKSSLQLFCYEFILYQFVENKNFPLIM